MRFLVGIFLFLIPLELLGFKYDSPLLQIGAKLFPKILFMEKETKERINSNIHIVVVSSSAQSEAAKRLADMIETYYPEGINNHPIRLSALSLKEAQTIKSAHAIILLASSDDIQAQAVVVNANENQILTFSLDPSLLQTGVAVSLSVGKTIKPYLNLSTMKNAPFSFEYGFIKLSLPYND